MKLHRHQAGEQVLIIEDCREGGTATGKLGVYEGDFPYSVALHLGDDFLPGEWLYADYESGALAIDEGVPVKDIYPLWTGGEPPAGPYAMAMDNPRIRLEGGSIIWGCECWWDKYLAEVSLADAQADLDGYKVVLRRQSH